MSTRDVVFPAGRQALYDHHRYSAAVRSDGFLFVSGTVGSREDGSPEPDFEQQVRLAFSNLQAILHAAGAVLTRGRLKNADLQYVAFHGGRRGFAAAAAGKQSADHACAKYDR